MLRCAAGAVGALKRPRPLPRPPSTATAPYSITVLAGGLDDERRHRQRRLPAHTRRLDDTTRLYVWLLDGPAGAERLLRRRRPPLAPSTSSSTSASTSSSSSSCSSRRRRLPPPPSLLAAAASSSTSSSGKSGGGEEGSTSTGAGAARAGGAASAAAGKGVGGTTVVKGSAEKSEHVVKLALGGNVIITAAKFIAWMHSGSSAMLSESIHSLVDCGNQTLLLIGIRAAATAPDRHHQYGYGKSVYFWSLVSALGTFWLGAGVSLRNSFQDLMSPTVQLEEITWDVWGVLGISFLIDGSVLSQTLHMLRASQPAHLTLWEHIRRVRDPTTLAVLLEDSGACVGVLMAIVGIGVSQATNNPVFDSIGGVCISGLLAAMGLALARLNERYLLGQAVDSEIVDGIRKLLMARPGIDNVQSVQSQWIGPYTFAYKAEVDFDGTYLAAKLMARYEDEFLGSPQLKDDLPVLLAFYAEDVVRTLEREVRDVEREIRAIYPEAQFIELEPASKDTTSFAIDGHREKMLRELEHVTLNQLLIAIAKNVVKQKPSGEGAGPGAGAGAGTGKEGRGKGSGGSGGQDN